MSSNVGPFDFFQPKKLRQSGGGDKITRKPGGTIPFACFDQRLFEKIDVTSQVVDGGFSKG